MRVDSARAPQTSALIDSTSEHGTPSVGHYIHQVLLVSDNWAHNRLYEFIGQEEILDRLRKHELKKTRILHRLSAPEFSFEDNRYANPVSFYHADTLIYRQPERHAPAFQADPDIEEQLKGKGYVDNEGKLITEPFDFTNRNFYPLEEQVQVLKAIMFPSFVKADQQFCIHPDDYAFLHREMALLPRESRFPSYDTTEFYDSYAKFFMFGDRKSAIPSHIRIFNKAGWAYGYMTDCAYIVDFQNKVEFILAATILVNDDEVFNDEKYEFETIGLPYLAGLGRAFYQHELNRKRKHTPELSSLQELFSEKPNQ
jgi:hypothetical protein